MLVVHHVFRPDNTVQILEVGAAIPWHACALGKAWAAFLEEGPFADVLRFERVPLTGRTIVDEVALDEALAAVRRDGFAIEDQEAVLGEAEVAAAVLDHVGVPIGAIGVVGPAGRLLPDGLVRDDVVAAVKDVARGLARDLGGVRRYVRSR